MTTIESPPEGEPTAAPDDPKRGPIWRVVVGSLLTGLLGALVLTLVVFAGAREHVISGSALLAFAFGWAMLAVLSTRLTSQPQRWPLVPAAFMTVVGLALLVLSPGDRALNAAGWVWPLFVFALAVWMFIQVRRSLGGRVRWLLYPVIGVLAVGSVGGMYERVALTRDDGKYAMPGQLIDVGDFGVDQKGHPLREIGILLVRAARDAVGATDAAIAVGQQSKTKVLVCRECLVFGRRVE